METPKKKVVVVKKVESPVSTPAKSSSDKRRERTRSIILEVENKRKEIESTDQEHEKVKQDIKKLKKEIFSWMKETGNERIVWKNKSINSHRCVQLRRTEASDVLEAVERLFDRDALLKVIDELDKLHMAKYQGEFDVRFLNKKPMEKGHSQRERRVSNKSVMGVNKAKKSLIL